MEFVAICSTFMIYCIKIYIQNIVSNFPNSLVNNIREIIGTPEENNNIQTLQYLKDTLVHSGGDDQLLIYLTRLGGTSKYHVIFTRRYFCKEFSASLQVMLDECSFMIPAYKGSTAALLDGMQIHKGAHLSCKRNTDEIRE